MRCGMAEKFGEETRRRGEMSSHYPAGLSLLMVCFAIQLSSCVGRLGDAESTLVSFDSVGCSGGLVARNAPLGGLDPVGSLSG